MDEIDGEVLAQRTENRVPIQFELRREAGIFTFEGEQDGREAWGDFTWTGSADFLRQMSRRGFDDLTKHEQFSMTMFDVSTEFLDGMDGRVARITNTQSAFGAQLDSLADMVSFGVAPALVVFRDPDAAVKSLLAMYVIKAVWT